MGRNGRRLGSSGALTKTLDTLNAAVLAAVPVGAEGSIPAGSALMRSELLPELSRMLTAAGGRGRDQSLGRGRVGVRAQKFWTQASKLPPAHALLALASTFDCLVPIVVSCPFPHLLF
jgi:hypothetical protein